MIGVRVRDGSTHYADEGAALTYCGRSTLDSRACARVRCWTCDSWREHRAYTARQLTLWAPDGVTVAFDE